MYFTHHGLSFKIKSVVHNRSRQRVCLIFSIDFKNETTLFSFKNVCTISCYGSNVKTSLLPDRPKGMYTVSMSTVRNVLARLARFQCKSVQTIAVLKILILMLIIRVIARYM